MLGPVVAIPAALIFAAPINAAPLDTQFLTMLDRDGITYPNIQQIINYAHGVCYELDIGVPHLRVIDNVLVDNPALDWDHAMAFTVDAYMTYCPWNQLPPGPQGNSSNVGYS